MKPDRPQRIVPVEPVDLAFEIRGRSLPVDHAHALSRAVGAALAWFDEEAGAGLHLVRVAESGNGWLRPEGEGGQVLHLSRRTRLRLRLPERRIEAARRLEGTRLDVDGHELGIGPSAVRRLSAHSTLFARHVVAEEPQEQRFLERVTRELRALGIPAARLLCGKMREITRPSTPLITRGLLVADLEPTASVTLQAAGLGPGRKLGCGLFVPHKGLDSVSGQVRP